MNWYQSSGKLPGPKLTFYSWRTFTDSRESFIMPLQGDASFSSGCLFLTSPLGIWKYFQSLSAKISWPSRYCFLANLRKIQPFFLFCMINILSTESLVPLTHSRSSVFCFSSFIGSSSILPIR